MFKDKTPAVTQKCSKQHSKQDPEVGDCHLYEVFFSKTPGRLEPRGLYQL